MQKWEYIVVRSVNDWTSKKTAFHKQDEGDVVIEGLSSEKQMFDTLGNQGWELIEIRRDSAQWNAVRLSEYIFKRPKP